MNRRRREIQVPSPPPTDPSAFSGPRLAPPISETGRDGHDGGDRARVDAFVLQVSNKPDVSSGRWVNRRSRPTSRPAAAVTRIHHHRPPNQPGVGSVYQLLPKPTTPMNSRPATAPHAPSDRPRSTSVPTTTGSGSTVETVQTPERAHPGHVRFWRSRLTARVIGDGTVLTGLRGHACPCSVGTYRPVSAWSRPDFTASTRAW